MPCNLDKISPQDDSDVEPERFERRRVPNQKQLDVFYKALPELEHQLNNRFSEEVTIETLNRVYQAWSQSREDWGDEWRKKSFGFAKKINLEFYRKRNYSISNPSYIESLPDNAGLNIEQQVENESLSNVVYEIVLHLPKRQRQVILLYYYDSPEAENSAENLFEPDKDKMRQQDIAKRLNISQSAVSQRLKDAKENIRRRLKNTGWIEESP